MRHATLALAVLSVVVLGACAGGSGGGTTPAAPATHFTVTGYANPTIAGASHMLTLSALDVSNNTVTGYAGTVHFTSSDGAAALPADATLTSGTGTFSVTMNTAGTQLITATDTVTSSITGSQTGIVVDAGAPASVTATTGMAQTTTISTVFAIPLTATVRDAGGNPVPNVSVTFAAPSSGPSGTFASSASVTVFTNASGVATASVFMANNTPGGPYTVTATVAGVATPANFTLTNIDVI